MNNSHCFTNLSPLTFLERAGRYRPGMPAVVLSNRIVSFGEMLHRSRRMASMLRSLGVSSGDRVGLLAHNSLLSIEAHYGIPATGAMIVAFNPWLPSSDIAKQITFSGTQVLLVNTDTYQQARRIVKGTNCRTVLVLDDGNEPLIVDPETFIFESTQNQFDSDLALDLSITDENAGIAINFTSGTTGEPKGVMYSHRAAYLHAMGQTAMLGLTRKSRYFWSLPMFHVNGWGHMWAAVAASAPQVVDIASAGLDYEGLAKRVAEAGATHIAGAPRILRHIIGPGHEDSVLNGLTVLTGGSAPTPDLVKFAIKQGVDLIHQYGLSETCGPFVVCEPADEWDDISLDQQAEKRLRQGIPALHAGVGLRVVDDNFNDVGWDGRSLGEVVMSGNSVALGYFNNPDATAKAFKHGWFCSGDIAVIHPDGYLEIKDRIKDLIFVETAYGWENISSIEIENVIAQFPGIRDIAVVGKRGANPAIIAFYEKDSAALINQEDVSAFCRKTLPEFKVPAFYFETTLPKTATGKVKKNVLEAEIHKLIPDI